MSRGIVFDLSKEEWAERPKRIVLSQCVRNVLPASGDEETPLITPTAYEKLLIAYRSGGDSVLAHIDFDGGNKTTLVGNFAGGADIEDIIGWDETLDRIFYMAQGGGDLFHIAADGSGSSTQIGTGSAAGCTGDMDKAGRRIFYGLNSLGRVKLYDIASGTVSVLYSSGSNEGVSVVYDPTRDMVYAMFHSSDTIRRMNTDGTGAVDLYTGTSWTKRLAIDPFNGDLYFLEDNGFNTLNSVKRLSLGTLDDEVLVTEVITNVTEGHVSLRLENRTMFVVDKDGSPGTLTRYSLDGEEPSVLDQGTGTNEYFCSRPVEREYV